MCFISSRIPNNNKMLAMGITIFSVLGLVKVDFKIVVPPAGDVCAVKACVDARLPYSATITTVSL